jgi:membrane protein implicated in regulation of membrane protease activity
MPPPDLVQVMGHAAMRPVKDAASEAAQRWNWKLIVFAALAFLAVWLLRRFARQLIRRFSGK